MDSRRGTVKKVKNDGLYFGVYFSTGSPTQPDAVNMEPANMHVR